MTFADEHNTAANMDVYWSKTGAGYFESRRWFYELLTTRILKHAPVQWQTLLEVGAAGGYLLAEVHKHRPDLFIVANDYSNEGLELAKQQMTGWKKEPFFWCSDITDAKRPWRFDCIVCSQTLEHIKDYDAAIANMVWMLTEGGRLIITVPNGLTDGYKGHHNRWTMPEFAGVLAKHSAIVLCELLTENHIIAVVKRKE